MVVVEVEAGVKVAVVAALVVVVVEAWVRVATVAACVVVVVEACVRVAVVVLDMVLGLLYSLGKGCSVTWTELVSVLACLHLGGGTFPSDSMSPSTYISYRS